MRTSLERVQYLIGQGVTPGQPRREVAQEFFTNALELGRLARASYIEECEQGLRVYQHSEIAELDQNLAIVEAELARYT